MTLQVHSDRHILAACKENEREVLVRISAPKTGSSHENTPLRISFALDCSGSMKGQQRLEYSKLAIRKALALMGDNDAAALTTFAKKAETIASLTKTDDEGQQVLGEKINEIKPDGPTNLFEGWELAADALKDVDGEIARILLLSDGHTNEGDDDLDTICRAVTLASSRGIRTSVLGVGYDYDDELLHAISAAGHGNFYLAESQNQIPEFVKQEVIEARQIIARGAVLNVELPAGAKAHVLGDWVKSTDGHITSIQLPDLIADQMVEIGMLIYFPAFADQERVRVGFDLSAQGALSQLDEVIYAVGDTDGQIRDHALFAAVADLQVQSTMRAAIKTNRAGYPEFAGIFFDDLCLDFLNQGIDPDDFPELFEVIQANANQMRSVLLEHQRKTISHASTMALRTRTNTSSPRRKED